MLLINILIGMKTCKIFIKKNLATKDKFNKNLINFLINNVSAIVQSDIFIRIVLVNDNNIKSVQSIGVKSTPAFICGNDSRCIIGVDNIIKKIIEMCEGTEEEKKTESTKKKAPVNDECDDVKDMLMGILQSGDDEECDEDGRDLKQKIQERLNHRAQGESTTRNNADTYKKLKENNEYSGRESIDMKLSTGNSQEDDAMAKYWANQEETDF